MTSALSFEPALEACSPEDMGTMLKAGARIKECYRVLGKGGLNIVGEVLKGQGTF